MTPQQKLAIACALEAVGDSPVEAGFPSSTPSDFEAVRLISKTAKSARFASLSRATRADVRIPAEAVGVDSHAIEIMAAGSDIHLEQKRGITRAEGRSEVVDAIGYAVSPGFTDPHSQSFYEGFHGAARLAGGIPRTARLCAPDWRWDSAELAAAFGPRTREVGDSPTNPTSGILQVGELAEMADRAEAWDVTVISDEVYAGLVFDGREHVSVADVLGPDSGTHLRLLAAQAARGSDLRGPSQSSAQGARGGHAPRHRSGPTWPAPACSPARVGHGTRAWPSAGPWWRRRCAASGSCSIRPRAAGSCSLTPPGRPTWQRGFLSAPRARPRRPGGSPARRSSPTPRPGPMRPSRFQSHPATIGATGERLPPRK